MPTNRIQVEYENGAATCKVWDGAGVEHDCTPIFQQLRDMTASSRETASLALRADSLETSVAFQATKKELVFDVDAAVVDQIVQML